MRRGWQVYKEVCSACHSMHYINYYHLINATHSREEAKALAADAQVSAITCYYQKRNMCKQSLDRRTILERSLFDLRSGTVQIMKAKTISDLVD